MGVRILHDRDQDLATLYCSTTDQAFGPVFSKDDDHDADERADAFCRWLGVLEPRRMSDRELGKAYADWRDQEAAQWAQEQAFGEVWDELVDASDARKDERPS